MNLICDFCSRTDPTWEFPCKTFTAPPILGTGPAHCFLDGWIACDECKVDVEAGRFEEVAARWKSRLGIPDVAWPRFRDALALLHREFTAHRTGDPVRL